MWSGSYSDTPGDIGPEEWAQDVSDGTPAVVREPVIEIEHPD